VFEGDRGLRGVSLDVAPGQIFGLLGPNGAGKTSLIRAICGRLRLTTGSVSLCGRDPSTDRGARGALGLVPQRIAVHQELTVRENLEILGRLAGVAAGALAERVRWGLDWSDLTPRAGDLARTLSGGMQRRLNLVAGVLHRPQVLLLDEPTVGVDPDARLRLHALLEKLRDDGMALLLTTHDLDEASALCDEIAFLVDGQVRASGTLDALVHETLGGAQHLEVLLDTPPPEGAIAPLEALGLRASRDPARWLGAREGGLGTLAEVERTVRELSLPVRQVTLVEPGLREVFLHLTGRELDS
jgi:ABC-2 type transport system ATP-binding protein